MPLPFSLFLPAHSRRAIRAVFGPVGLRREHGPALDAAFHLVPALADLGAQGRIQREDGGPKPPAQQRIGKMCIRDRLKVTSQKFHQTIVMITHNPEIAAQADRTIHIEDGRIAE